MSDKYATMYDMATSRISARIPDALGRRLRKHARMKGTAESEVVREALETFLAKNEGARSAYEVAKEAGLIGCVRGAPRDLSTHPRHWEGFGKRR
jgi:predicted DNA-binding protein